MAATQHVYVFTYDIAHDPTRVEVAAMLEDRLVRVQKSVFEGHMSRAEARRLAERIHARMNPEDSLRVYALTSDGIDASFAFGICPLPEKSAFLVL